MQAVDVSQDSSLNSFQNTLYAFFYIVLIFLFKEKKQKQKQKLAS